MPAGLSFSPTDGGRLPMFDPGSFGFGGQNQWMNFPSMTSGPQNNPMMTPPGVVPSAGGGQSFFPDLFGGLGGLTSPWGDPSVQTVGSGGKLRGGAGTGPTIDPRFTQALDLFLRGQIGKGATPFGLSSVLPSTGGITGPGTLTAPENPIMKLLQQFFQTGQGGPLPGVLPMWTAEMEAMKRPEAEALANLREQFSFMGDLASSPFGKAVTDFETQAALGKEALLGQLTLQALPQMAGFGEFLQGLDQASIDRLVQEFIRTRPEYSPLLGEEFGLATTFPPIYTKKGGVGQALIGSSGDIAGGVAALIAAL